MAAEQEFDRVGVRAGDEYGSEWGRAGRLREEPGLFEVKPAHAGQPAQVSQPANGGQSSRTGQQARAAEPVHAGQPAQEGYDPSLRGGGSPLPMGTSGRPLSGHTGRGSAPPPGRALSVQSHTEPEGSGTQWLAGVFKQAVPFVQKLLPLLDGQIATAVANLIARPHTPPAPHIDLEPVENGLADLRREHFNLKDQIADQIASLKRVEDHLEMVREATDRNTLEQQELIEDLKVISSRMNRLAFLFLALLVVSVLVNVALFLHIQRVLP
jgi:hypothetical protein